MSSLNNIIKRAATIVVLLALICCSLIEAKLLRRSRLYENSYDAPYATGERAMLSVRGARNPYDGSAPSRITIEDNPYRGQYPRGIYDRLDSGYVNSGRIPHYPRQDHGYGGYNSGYSQMFGAPNRIAVTGAFPYGYGSRYAKIKRHDLMDPDFDIKASMNLTSKKLNRCRLQTEADSEIPELGFDSGRLNIDCNLNPARVADAAVRLAFNYGKYRRNRQRNRGKPHRSAGSTVKRKRTSINIDSEYERSRNNADNDDNKTHKYSDRDYEDDN